MFIWARTAEDESVFLHILFLFRELYFTLVKIYGQAGLHNLSQKKYNGWITLFDRTNSHFDLHFEFTLLIIIKN